VENFELFTPQDRRDISYAACLGGSTVTLMAAGGVGLLPGLLGGAAMGLALGLLSCRKLAPAIERKIFSNQPLTEQELSSVLKVLRSEAGVQSKTDAMYLFSQAHRAAKASGPKMLASQSSAPNVRVAAATLLSRRSV
jgi:hypothetical protein